MKQKTMVLIALAVVCGLGASFMTSKLLADRKSEEEMVKVLVAKKNLDTGMMIKKPEDSFEEKEVPKETAPKNALSQFVEVKGRQLKIPRRQGDTITQDDLFDDKSPGLMSTLPPGHRAVGIRVSSEQIAAGFAAVPHSRIDIACSVRCNNDKDCGTRLILQNVLVLASGQATIRDDGGKAMLCDVVTVALTPEDALKLETAKNKGGLSMFLRPFGESGFVNTPNMTWEAMISKKGVGSADENEDGPKGPNSAVPNLEQLVSANPQPAVAPAMQQPANDKFVQRIVNEAAVRYVYKRDADGQYESQPADAVEPGTAARPAPRSNVAAPAPTPAPAPQKKQ